MAEGIAGSVFLVSPTLGSLYVEVHMLDIGPGPSR